jgi:AhpD family alkylhydroperoxidase
MPELNEAYAQVYRLTFRDGALDKRTKEIIAFITGILMRCHSCAEIHLKLALKEGATKEQLMEAAAVVWNLAGGTQIGWATLLDDLFLEAQIKPKQKIETT